jgi:hypothetical protein
VAAAPEPKLDATGFVLPRAVSSGEFLRADALPVFCSALPANVRSQACRKPTAGGCELQCFLPNRESENRDEGSSIMVVTEKAFCGKIAVVQIKENRCTVRRYRQSYRCILAKPRVENQ